LNFPFYIAKRYLKSKKSHNIINIISGVSIAGVSVGTMALIVILSVFNGFEEVVVSLFNSFDPDLKITVVKGKSFDRNDIPANEIKEISGIKRYTEVVEENALAKYNNTQDIITIKGVTHDFVEFSGLDSMLVYGNFVLKENNNNFCVVGYGIAYKLNLSMKDKTTPINVYMPKRTKKTYTNIDQAFNSKIIFPSGIFSVQQEFDSKYMIVPIDFARDLLEYTDEVTSIEIGLDKTADADQIQDNIQSLVGESFVVKNRLQQQELLYQIMKSEKWAIFMILTFVLIIAAFNIIGSLSMIIIDKKKDIAVLRSLGASNQHIRKIFLTEGFLISLTGGMLGLILGGVICWLQSAFELIKLSGSGSFIIDAYPVKTEFLDFILVFLTVAIIGIGAAFYSVRQISKSYFDQRLS